MTSLKRIEEEIATHTHTQIRESLWVETKKVEDKFSMCVYLFSERFHRLLFCFVVYCIVYFSSSHRLEIYLQYSKKKFFFSK